MGEEGAAMGLLNKLFRFSVPCGGLTPEKIMKEQREIRARVEDMKATLNGEDEWFLVKQKMPPQGGINDHT
jgi:hypothetical protein